MKSFVSMLLFAAALAVGPAQAAEPVPFETLFKHSEFSQVELSPTGEYLAVSVPEDDKTLLAVLRTADKSIVSKWDFGDQRHVVDVRWVNDERFLVRVAKQGGVYDFLTLESPDIFASNADGSRRKDLEMGGTYNVVSYLDHDPDHVLVVRSIERPNLFRLNVYTGRLAKEAVSPVEGGSFAVDHDGRVRYAFGVTDTNKSQTWRREADGEWVMVHEAPDTSGYRYPRGFTADNKRIYMMVSEQGEPADVVLFDPETRAEEVLFEAGEVDIRNGIWNHDGTRLLGVAWDDGVPRKRYFDDSSELTGFLVGLDHAFPKHDVTINNWTRDGRLALVEVASDVDPGRMYLFDRDSGKATFLLARRGWIDPEQMNPSKGFRMEARDGTPLYGYLTLPKGKDPKGLPMVVHPHGGPHGPRDWWGFNPHVQAMASRGYAVLQVNFRGSGGYGRKFEFSGFRRWGLEMQDDLTDAVHWAIEQGYADRDRICIYGASYGGYAALMSPVREPDLYQCTIGFVGVYNLPMFMTKGDIPRFETGRKYLARVAPEDDAGRRAQSPAHNLDKLKAAVMLAHGRRDERVPVHQMYDLVERLEEVGKKPEAIVLEDKEAHGFYKPENNARLYTEITKFLDRHIGSNSAAAAAESP